MKHSHVAMAVAWLVSASLTAAHAQRGPGATSASQRLWWVAKAAPGQYGTNKLHIKLSDLKARHKGEAVGRPCRRCDVRRHQRRWSTADVPIRIVQCGKSHSAASSVFVARRLAASEG